MKTMKKQMMTLAAVLMAGAAVTSCSSDSEMDSLKAPAGKTYTMTVQATKGGDETRALNLDGNTLNATWATTENVYVKKGSDWATGLLNPQTAGASTTLKGTLSGVTIEASDEITLQFPKSGDITYAGQKGTLADIAENFDWATATATVANVEDGKITVNGNVTFVNQQAVVKFTLKNGDDALSATKLVVNVGGTEYEVNPESAANEIYAAIPGFTGQTITLTATVGTDTYTCTASSKSFTNGKYYRVTAKMTKQAAAPAGAEAVDLGLSVKWANMNVGASSEGDYGQFFAWGETTGYGSNTADGHNFGWTSYSLCGGSKTTLNKYNNVGSNGTVDNKTTLEEADDAATANWGSNWRMPTYDELNELYATKSNTTDYTWTWTTVDGHNGWRITSKKSGTSGNSIFLPASGRRSDTSLNNQGTNGYYWSSSLEETNARSGRYLNFDSGSPSMGYYSRNTGHSVRPVQGAAAPAVPTGALSGKFSVSATKKVYFSKGNLYYDADATTKWYFATNQWDCISISPATGYPMDLFTWGNIDNPAFDGTDFYNENADLSGSTDWGSRMGTGWRTLTGGSGGEWEYLFNTRTTATTNMPTGTNSSAARYTKATVAGVPGVILFPDNYAHPDGVTVTVSDAAYNTGTKAYTTFTVDASNWGTMQSAGCVFLPAAGHRYSTSVDNVGSHGRFWSSTADGTGKAYSVDFDSGGVNPADNNYRNYGFSVRLVHDVE